MSTTSGTSSYCQCQKKDMMEELNHLIDSIDESSDIVEIARVADKCLRTLSLMEAAEYMIKHKKPVTDENISIFMNVATQACNFKESIKRTFFSSW